MPLSHSEFAYLRDLARRDAAIVLEPEKAYRVESCLGPLARQEGHPTVSDLVRHVQGAPRASLQRRVVDALTINETSFFRDGYPFEALREEVLPGLIARRGRERRLSVWCAGCATGQEPYSVALTVRDHFPELDGWAVRVHGTDLVEPLLERARTGLYTQLEVSRGLSPEALAKHFTREGALWRLRDGVARLVDFRPLNLAEPWSAAVSYDVVFLRNVLIYFDAATRREVLRRVRAVLRPDGALFLGGAESTLHLSDDFERVPFGRHGYFRPAASASATRQA